MIFHNQRRFRKFIFRGIVGVVLALSIFLVADFSYGLLTSNRPPAQVNINYYYNNVGAAKVVALTFDDGPSPGRTEAIMDVLKREQVPATFFFIGSRALRYPALVKKAAENGFEIGNHSFTHSQTAQSSNWRLRLELNLTDTIIETITRQPIRLYRPPYLLDIGSDPTTAPTGSQPQLYWALQNGYVVVGADVDPKDWVATSPKQNVDALLEKMKGGGHIILLHDGSSERYTIAALTDIIHELRARGYRFTTASDLLGLDAAKKMAITQDLVPGATDAKTDGSVTALQQFMIMSGYSIVDRGGTYGASTQAAVVDWQVTHNLPDTKRVVDRTTRMSIADAITATMYQPLPSHQTNTVFLFSDASRVYISLAPAIATTVIWITRIVILLVLVRLIMTLLFRGVAAVNGYARPSAWTKPVTVVIPAYNEEDNIGATITSVLNSTYEHLKILVVNDGSKDKTAEIVRGIIKDRHDRRVRLVNLKNGGKARALNHSLHLAKTEVIVFMDGDTIFDRYTIARLVRHFHDPSVAAVAGRVCATRSRNILNVFQSAEYIITQNMDKRAFNEINAIGVVPGPVGAWRRSFVLAAGGFSLDTLVEDQDLTLALLAAGHRIVYESQAYAYSETPFHLKDFIKQRSRWIFGTVQCLWKYKRHFLSFERPALGWVVLPNTLIFTVLISLLVPLMDFLLILAIITGSGQSAFIVYLIFTAIDLLYAGLALYPERGKRWLIVLLPLQRIFYRIVIALVVWRSVIKAIEGATPLWNKVRKRGDAHAFHLQLLSEAVPQTSVPNPLDV